VIRALASIDLGAIERNCSSLRSRLRDGCRMCAVVKADGYGHGGAPVADAALRAGADWLAVATAREALALREAAQQAPQGSSLASAPLLVLGPTEGIDLEIALGSGADVVIWSERQLEAVSDSEHVQIGGHTARVHVKLDTGMGRLGTRDPAQVLSTAERALSAEGIELAGLMTHFATADQLGDEGFFAGQLAAFGELARALKERRPRLIAHCANSAAVLREPASHFDMVRCGIALYGMDPFGTDPFAHGLEPALALRSSVAEVKRCRAGQSAGYGRRFIAQRDTWLGVLPIGYGDGYRRAFSNNAEVLIAGRRFPVVGTVSMDSITVDLGPAPESEGLRGAEAVLLGASGDERITAEALARRIDTINYEITCGLTRRVDRAYTGRPGVGVDWEGGVL
jgi:alanine racemase